MKPNASILRYLFTALACLISNGAHGSTLEAVSSATGWLSSVHGDDFSTSRYEIRYTLTTDDGSAILLDIDQKIIQAAGGNLAIDGRYVEVDYQATYQPRRSEMSLLRVLSIREADEAGTTTMQRDSSGQTRAVISGSRPWISVLCKFSDVADEPKDLNYFKEMYGSTYPGLDHYWREVSFDKVNIAGSDAVGWFTLPNPVSYYNPSGSAGGTDLNTLRDDCLSVADPVVDFTQFEGINMMFNINFDDYAWGGGSFLTLDGETRLWRVTWEPPWGYSSITVMAHEMGHGFGLPHSSGTYGLTYDNVWDVMSDTWTFCALSQDAAYGCLGQHTIAWHKDILGWIPESQKLLAETSSIIAIDHIALPASGNVRLIQIPIADSQTHFYTVEARNLEGYDVKLPGKAIVIHEVDTTRSRPANIIDVDGNGLTGDDGAIWLAGEVFSDTDNGIFVRVLSETATGFIVSVSFPGETAVQAIHKRLLKMYSLILID